MLIDRLAEHVDRTQGCYSTILLNYWSTPRMSLDVLLDMLIELKDVTRPSCRIIDRPQGCYLTILLKTLIDLRVSLRPSCWKHWSTSRRSLDRLVKYWSTQGCRLNRTSWKYWSTPRMSLDRTAELLIDLKDVTRPSSAELLIDLRMSLDRSCWIIDRPKGCGSTILSKQLTPRMISSTILLNC